MDGILLSHNLHRKKWMELEIIIWSEVVPIIRKKKDFAYFCQKLQTKPQLVIFKEHFDTAAP